MSRRLNRTDDFWCSVVVYAKMHSNPMALRTLETLLPPSQDELRQAGDACAQATVLAEIDALSEAAAAPDKRSLTALREAWLARQAASRN